MKKEEITYRQLIDQLRQHPPVPENPEELTASILACIRDLPVKKSQNKVLLFTAWICGTAALFLIGLLCLELFLTPAYQPQQKNKDLPPWYSSTCMEERDTRKRIECFLQERENRKSQTEFLFRTLKK